MIHNAAGIVAKESGRCGADYRLLGSHYGQALRGERLVRSRPSLRWWLETTVLAHLVGRPSHAIAPELRRQVEDLPLGALKTAIAFGVDEAVAVRSAAILPKVSAGSFAEHVAEALWDSLLTDSATVCPAEERWVAAPFEDTIAIDTLTQQARWSRAAAKKLEELQWSWAKRHSAKCVHQVVLGQDEPSTIERVVDAERTSPHWQRAIARAGDHGPIDPMVAGILCNLPR